jgi:hypothetical protein
MFGKFFECPEKKESTNPSSPEGKCLEHFYR